MILFIRDMIAVIIAWTTIWFKDEKDLRRSRRFVSEALNDKRKRSIPVRLWFAAYRLRLDC